MGFLIDLAPGQQPALHFVRRVPGPVRHLCARVQTGGSLLLWWKPPAGGTWVDGYRIERTLQGRDYELLGTTDDLEFTVADPTRGEPWFYRVTAYNTRGAGRARLVYFYRRPDREMMRRRSSFPAVVLQSVPVIPGVRVEISDLVPER